MPITSLYLPSYSRGVEQLVARRAHNPKVVGSSPASATRKDGSVYLLVRFLFVHPSLHH